MTLLDLPYLNGKKTIIGSYGLLIIGIAGLIATFGSLVEAIGHCISGDLTIQQCVQNSQVTFLALISAFEGIKGIGLGHKIEKSSV